MMFTPNWFFSFVFMILIYIGYRMGKDRGYDDGEREGRLTGFLDAHSIPEKERNALYRLLALAASLKEPKKIQKLKRDIEVSTNPLLESLNDSGGLLSDIRIPGIMSPLARKYRDFLIVQLDVQEKRVIKDREAMLKENGKLFKKQQRRGVDKNSKYSITYDDKEALVNIKFDKNPGPERAYNVLKDELKKSVFHFNNIDHITARAYIDYGGDAEVGLLGPMLDFQGCRIILAYNPTKNLLIYPEYFNETEVFDSQQSLEKGQRTN